AVDVTEPGRPVGIVNENAALSNRVALELADMEIIYLVLVWLMTNGLDRQNPSVASKQFVADANVSRVHPTSGGFGALGHPRQVLADRPLGQVFAADDPEGMQERGLDFLVRHS